MTIEHTDRGPLDKDELAALVAADIPDGAFVNLGSASPPPWPTISPPNTESCFTPRTACWAWAVPLLVTRSTPTSSTPARCPSSRHRERRTSITPTRSR